MFKRANKITALLVAAASVMSIVPAMAADSTRLGTKDGTIESAVAFNGKYIYEGYKGDSDKAVYFNDGSKDKELTDYEDYDFTTSEYADKYILATDNGDDYLTDLSSGNITEDTLDDKEESTASKLQKALTKTDKYDGATIAASNLTPVTTSGSFQEEWYSVNTASTGNNTIFTDANGKYIDSSVLGNIYAYSSVKGKMVKVEKFNKQYDDSQLEVDLATQPKVIAQDKDNLYAIVNVDIKDTNPANAAVSVKATGTVDLSTAKYETTPTVVSGDKDKYVIAYTGTDTVIIGGTTYTSGTDTIATVEAAVRALTAYDVTVEAGTGNIIATAKATGVVATAAITGSATTRTPGTADTAGTPAAATFTVGTTTFTYDAASGAGKYKDEADLKNKIIAVFAAAAPSGYTFDVATLKFTATADKTVAQVTADLGTKVTVKAGSIENAGARTTNAWYLQVISKAQGDTDEEAYEPKDVKSYQIDNKSLYDNGDAADAYDWLIDGNAIDTFRHVEVKDNSLYVYKLNSANDNVKVLKLDLKQIKENPINKDTTAEFGTTKLDGYVVKKDGDTDQDYEALSVDTNGILWVLNDGKIIKFAEKEKTTVYTVDSGFDSFDVYDQQNLIAWSYDDERYTTVTEGTEVTAAEATVVAPVVVTGWVQDGANWSFNDATGTKVTNKWVNVGGAWYFLKADGVMATNWYNDNGTWYFLNASGAMATGWVNDNGTWYYLNASGAMLANTTVDGYVLGASGAWVK